MFWKIFLLAIKDKSTEGGLKSIGNTMVVRKKSSRTQGTLHSHCSATGHGFDRMPLKSRKTSFFHAISQLQLVTYSSHLYIPAVHIISFCTRGIVAKIPTTVPRAGCCNLCWKHRHRAQSFVFGQLCSVSFGFWSTVFLFFSVSIFIPRRVLGGLAHLTFPSLPYSPLQHW